MNATKRLRPASSSYSVLAMKAGFVLCGAVVVAWTGCTTYVGQPPEGGAYDASYAEIRVESDFYEPLSPYGRWEVVGSYGRCWIPSGVGADWSPYSNGYWQSTDAGWYWASDEPWGWATYHYGRWDSSPQYGWYWVPQTQWAPAWVSWREGGGYVGWAPLGPSGRGAVDVRRRGAAQGGYVFVEERRFLDHARPAGIVNDTVINKAVSNEAPGTAVIEKASGRKMQAIPVRQLRSQEEAKVVLKRPAPTPTRAQAVPAPVHNQTEKTPPARAPRQIEQPAITTAPPQPPATRTQVHQADAQVQAAKLDEEKRAQQNQAREKEAEKNKPIPAAVVARPEARPEPKVEARPEVKREAPPAARQETRSEAKVEAKAEAKVEVKREAPPAATRAPAEQKAGKDEEKQN